MEKNKTILIIRGGVLNDIITTSNNTEFVLIDWDDISQEGTDWDIDDRSFEPEIVSQEEMEKITSEIEEEIKKEKQKSQEP